MGHNTSHEKRRSAFQQLTLCELEECSLVILCRSCPDERTLPIATLIEHYGAERTLGWVVPRLRCGVRTCRQAPASVVLHPPMERRAQCVVLVGPGAY